ncbi:hypothetical protein G6F35_015240 [Rhizopus arrhizus]|nr:hypothetical protein G6F35_015240 [Rhizopus arrhizus]
MRMQRDGRLRRDGADRALLREHAGRPRRDGGVRLLSRDVGIGLGGGVQVLARMQHGAGRGGQVQRIRCIDKKGGAIDAFDRGIAGALAAGGLASGLAVDLRCVAAFLLRIQGLEQCVVALGRSQGACLMLAGAIVQTPRGVLRTAQQQQGFLRVRLRGLALRPSAVRSRCRAIGHGWRHPVPAPPGNPDPVAWRRWS